MSNRGKYYGNVFGIPTGSPDDNPFTGEYFPSGDHAMGYIRRSLPSERFLDEMVLPCRENREDGYLPSPPPLEFVPDESPERFAARLAAHEAKAHDYLLEKEGENRAKMRGMRISLGNPYGTLTGPPDRVSKKQRS